MTQLILSILNPNTLLPHRAGIAGLALVLYAIDSNSVPFSWEVTEEQVELSWNCSDRQAISSLLKQAYQVQDGYLDVPALNLDRQGKYTFTEGVITSFLQHNQQRSLQKEAKQLTFTIDEGQPEIIINFRPVEDCYYTKDFAEIFDIKGQLKQKIPLKGHHLPGLVKCFVHGTYQESPAGFLSLLFLPIVCNYYRLPEYRSAVVIPEVKNLQEWIKRRKKYSGKTYKDFRSSSSGEAALRFLIREKILEDNQQFRVDYCEVYQLGKQQWDGNQQYLKQAVYRVKVSDRILNLYESAFQFFPSRISTNKKGETWLSTSQILPWLCNNLITNQPWYLGFYDFCKQNKLYEKKGLISMSQYLEPLEQTFFDAIRGGFSSYLREQIIQAKKQGRKLDYQQVTDKVINRLQRPSTQQDFAKIIVDFLSRNRSKNSRGVGPEIYQWLHKNNQWKQARDLALLAIATYTGKSKDGTTEIPEEILDESTSQIESQESFEMSIN
jgi:CRISPR-associated protein Cas8a1/Csx13